MRAIRTMLLATVYLSAVLVMPAQTTALPETGPKNSVPVGPAEPVADGTIAGLMVKRVEPVLPPAARKIAGTVVLHVIVGRNGHIKSLEVVSGPEELRKPTVDAVKQWVYKPYLLNGLPTEVDTRIVMNYTVEPD